MQGKKIQNKVLTKWGLPRKGEAKSENDQVAVDVEKAKKTKDKLIGKVREQISPIISQATPKITSAAQPVKSMFGDKLVKKIGRIVVIAVLLIILLYIASLFVKNLRNNGEIALDGSATPTVAPYLPYNPSVYAENELVLQLEEDIKVLDRELSTIQLKVNILTPPELNFDINFEE